MIRYIATRIAHEKNPFRAQSAEWSSYNAGFIKGLVPTLPSRWEVLLVVLYTSPFLLIAAAVFLWG